ncbi:MAG: FadR family transcriptional regulator [Bacteroidetes bacterium]|uniref:FadR family transcriptional regulator n=1 Tax=Candidatus Cryptobacteroides merdigallinarum TaxID=2840770 RepID=A0A9D9HBL3_9BACT|nr:FadR family transcriptional regulator [Candidatus Cryptobacteroides merdigallinarum]
MKEDVTLVEQTQRDILKYISQNGNSSRLPKEQEFVELLGVSRVVVREALSRLRAVGIIETKRKKGTVVVVPEVFGVLKSIVASGLLDKDTLRDLYQLRLMLEIGMADFIYMNRTDAQMEELDRIVAEEVSLSNEMATADDMDQRYAIAKKLTDVDVRFHSKLFEMTGNKSLIDFQYILRHLFTLYYPKIRTDYHSRTLVSHVSLYNILRTSTPDAFRMGMRLHLKTQFDNMESILEKTFNNK